MKVLLALAVLLSAQQMNVQGNCAAARNGSSPKSMSEIKKSEPTLAEEPTSTKPQVQVTLAAEKAKYQKGEAVKFTITVHSTSDKAQTLKFRTGQSFDIKVMPNIQDETITTWQWSHDRMFTMALRDVELAAGQSLTFKATWKQVDNDGKALPAGTYIAQATLTTEVPVESENISVPIS